jgi:hypothetical protein
MTGNLPPTNAPEQAVSQLIISLAGCTCRQLVDSPNPWQGLSGSIVTDQPIDSQSN